MDRVVTHPLDPDDAAPMSAFRAMVISLKGKLRGIEAREPFEAVMERVAPRNDVTVEAGTVGGIPGFWVRPAQFRSGEAILYLHAGWFLLGTAKASRHLVAHVVARVGAPAFIPEYRLAPEHPFPAAVDDVMACYRGLAKSGIRRIAITGDSAGGNLALVVASSVTAEDFPAKATLVAVAVGSPVTDLTLSGETYETRAEADPFFTRSQVAELVHAYLDSADPKHPLASPLFARFSGLPAIRIDVGDDEVLLDDTRRYVERAIAAGVDARHLAAEVEAGRFREDLYYRLNVIELFVPPLRARKGDVALLACEFARKYSDRYGLGYVVQLSSELVYHLEQQPWRGNVRQLENTIARCVALSTTKFVGLEALLARDVAEATTDDGPSLREQVEAFERNLIARTIRSSNGNQSETSRRLQLNRTTLYDKLKKYGLMKE
jgi:monoterpene epsilon-lactone hydrolase